MAQANSGSFRGRVKAVPSGDSLVIVTSCTKDGIPQEKTIVLAHLSSPKLARRDSKDEPFAWESREFLRNLCVGQDVVYKKEYTIKNVFPEFCSVFINKINISREVVIHGWAKVKAPKGNYNVAREHEELLNLEEQAKRKGVGLWNKTPGAREAAIRKLPPSALGDQSNFDARRFFESNKFKSMEAIVEQVRDGSTLRVYLLPEFQFVQVYVAGIQAPSMGRRKPTEPAATITQTPPEQHTNSEKLKVLSTNNEVPPDPYGREAKHFTEIRVLNRDVWIVLEGVDKYSNLIASVYYPDGDSNKDLALELIENGFAKYVGWKAGLMENEAIRKLKAAELEAKKNNLRLWTNYIPPTINANYVDGDYKKKKEEFNVIVTEVLDGSTFYVQAVSDQKVATIQNQLASLTLKEAPVIGSFSPKKGDLVLAQFSVDKSWYRAMIVNTRRGAVQSLEDKFEVFYIDYGNQEVVTYSRLRPLDRSVSSAPGIAQLCSLAYLKVPTLKEEYGHDAAMILSEATLNGQKQFRAVIEYRERSRERVEGQGTGNILKVSLMDAESGNNVSWIMLEAGVARVEKRRKWEPKEKKEVLDELEEYQAEARQQRLGMWRYGDIDFNDDEKPLPEANKVGAGKR